MKDDPRSQNVGGYIARAEDVQHIKNYDEVFETLLLDYDQTPFLEGKNSYGLIKFKVQEPDKVSIPYSKVIGRAEDIKAPCTGNGFTAARNGEVIPEWKAQYELPKDKAELYRVVDGKEELVGKYDADLERFITEKNKGISYD